MQISCKTPQNRQIWLQSLRVNRKATRTGRLTCFSYQRRPSTNFATAFMYSESPTMKMLL